MASGRNVFAFYDNLLLVESTLESDYSGYDSSVTSYDDLPVPRVFQTDESGDAQACRENGVCSAEFALQRSTLHPFAGNSGVQFPFAKNTTALNVFQAIF